MTRHVLEIACALFIFGALWYLAMESILSIGCAEDIEEELAALISESRTGTWESTKAVPLQAAAAPRASCLPSANVVNDEQWTA